MFEKCISGARLNSGSGKWEQWELAVAVHAVPRAVASRQNWDLCNSQLLLQGESIPELILFKDIISLHNNALDCQIVEIYGENFLK